MKQVSKIIFLSKKEGTDITKMVVKTNKGKYPGRWFGNGQGGGTLRGFDFEVDDNGTTIALRILEQNPDKKDLYQNLKPNALLARMGHKITWVIRRDRKSAFIGKVQDGKFIPPKPRAVTKMMFNASIPGAGQVSPHTVIDQYGGEYQEFTNGTLERLPEIDPSEAVVYIAGI